MAPKITTLLISDRFVSVTSADAQLTPEATIVLFGKIQDSEFILNSETSRHIDIFKENGVIDTSNLVPILKFALTRVIHEVDIEGSYVVASIISTIPFHDTNSIAYASIVSTLSDLKVSNVFVADPSVLVSMGCAVAIATVVWIRDKYTEICAVVDGVVFNRVQITNDHDKIPIGIMECVSDIIQEKRVALLSNVIIPGATDEIKSKIGSSIKPLLASSDFTADHQIQNICFKGVPEYQISRINKEVQCESVEAIFGGMLCSKFAFSGDTKVGNPLNK